MPSLSIALPTSVLGFATTIHAAMVALRKERTEASVLPLVLLVSLALTATPWVFQTPVGLAIGLTVHVIWFVSCEKMLPRRQPQRALAPSPSGPRPVPPSKRAAAPLGAAAAPRPGGSAAAASAPRPRDFTPVPILAVYDETPTIRTFRLARPAGFGFEPGQFLTVRVQVDGKQHVRCYSISSAPEASGYIEISVKRQGLVSGMLFSVARPGSTLMVKPPNGKFVYPASDDRPIVLIAGGVGITPVMSMLRHAVVADPTRPVTLVYSARTEDEFAYEDELQVLVKRHQHVQVLRTVTGVAESQWRIGRLDVAMIQEAVQDLSSAVYLMCGPVQMIDGIRAGLERAGVPAAQVRSEVFQAVAAIGAKLPPRARADALVPAEAPAPSEAPAEAEASDDGAADEADGTTGAPSPRLVLVKSDRKASVAAEQCLLEAAEAAGVDIPNICRAGVCGTCKTRLIDGDVECNSDALDDSDRDAGFILPCVAWARGDCALDA